MTQNPQVSVVVLNWNGGSHVLRALDGVYSQTYRPIEVVVVDNASVDQSVDEIRAHYPECRVIRNGRNLGYAVAMNQGIRSATGEAILLLNSDVFLDAMFVARGVAAMQQHPDVGAIAPKVFRWVGDELTSELDSAGLMMRWCYKLAPLPKDSPGGYVFGPSGACPFLRKAALEDASLGEGQYFDDAYFAFGEDIDLWFRLHLRGWNCWYRPDIMAWHIHSASTGGKVRLTDKPEALQLCALRNRYLTILKDIPARMLLLQAVPLLAAEFVRLAYFAAVAPPTARLVLRALAETARMWPQIMALRRRIQLRRVVSGWYLLRFFVSP